MIKTKIDTFSVNEAGNTLMTAVLTYPRMIHSEVLTHSALVRNAASSRAIPVQRFIDAVVEDPAGFEQYGAANKGMTAQDLMSEEDVIQFRYEWVALSKTAVRFASNWKTRAAKQLVNRALEPWMHMTAVITGDAVGWGNFFALRAEASADPTFQVLAYRLLDRYVNATPTKLKSGQWHLPLISQADRAELSLINARARSVANCCRVSYTRHTTERSIEEDIRRHDGALVDGHMSPFAHQAYAAYSVNTSRFKGFMTYREILAEDVRRPSMDDLRTILSRKPDWIKLEEEEPSSTQPAPYPTDTGRL